MGFFYRFVADSMTLNFITPEAGKLTPYSAVLIFSIGVFLSNFVWNTYFMYKPVDGNKSTYSEYFANGTLKRHLIGLAGGLIFNTGLLFNLIASDKAGPAISYGLGQGSTMIGAAWGVFVFKQFKGAPSSIARYLGSHVHLVHHWSGPYCRCKTLIVNTRLTNRTIEKTKKNISGRVVKARLCVFA